MSDIEVDIEKALSAEAVISEEDIERVASFDYGDPLASLVARIAQARGMELKEIHKLHEVEIQLMENDSDMLRARIVELEEQLKIPQDLNPATIKILQETERDICAKIAEAYAETQIGLIKAVAKAIRARGKETP